MKIAIDISPIVYETGVSVYTQKLIEALLEIDQKNDYILYAGSMRRLNEIRNKTSQLKADKKYYHLAPTLGDLIWNRIHFFPIDILIGKVDIFHSSDWYQPKTSSCKITTIHDLSPILFPQYTPEKIVNTHKRRLQLVKEEVDRVIVPTNAIMSDLIKFGIKQEKIRVIPEAVDTDIFHPSTTDQVEKIKKKYGITKPFILAVGTGRRKNISKIIDIMNKLTEYELVVVGNNDGINHIDKGVIFTGHIPREDLPVLYTASSVLAYPSLYEGFGLPILEAFACGTPVVTSNIPVLSEVAGSAAVLVDPNDVQSLYQGIKQALTNSKSLSQKGSKRIQEFSWNKTARETLNVYEEFVK